MNSISSSDCDLRQPDILWVEADNEAQDDAPPSKTYRSLIAYILLGKRVIIHPAYIWQSDLTNNIMFGSVGRILKNANTAIFLGTETDSVASYMNSRVEKTSNIPELPFGLSEYQEYKRHDQRSFESQQAQIDDWYTAHGAVQSSLASRDQEFRKLVRQDLIPEGRTSERLSGILLRDIRVPERSVLPFLQSLSDWTRDERSVVSGDSIIAKVLAIEEFDGRTIRLIDKRLHVLHWACHVTENTRVPFVHREIDRGNLDAFDPEVFWTAMEALLGKKLLGTWLSLSKDDSFKLTCELRNDAVWTEFRNTYISIVTAIASNHRPVEEELVVREIQTALPSRARVVMNRIVGIPLISTVFGLIKLTYGDVVDGGTGSGKGLLSMGSSLISSLQSYNESLRSDLEAVIRSMLRRIQHNSNLT